MSKDQWIIAHERARDDYASGEIEVKAFIAEMQELGFDRGEINAEIKELNLDRNGGPTDAQTMKDFRERLGLSRKEAGKALGYADHQVVGMVERGDRDLTRQQRLMMELLERVSGD